MLAMPSALQSYDASKDGYYKITDAKQDSYALYTFKEPGTYWCVGSDACDNCIRCSSGWLAGWLYTL